MQRPLTRYTQCGSLTLLFIVVVLMFSQVLTALTTFGVNKPHNASSHAPTLPPKGRECSTNVDCINIIDTSCVRSIDYRFRCLCGDFQAPSNGVCQARMKGLRHMCSSDGDCEDFMICTEIVTKYANKERLCLCDEARGYLENIIERQCNAVSSGFGEPCRKSAKCLVENDPETIECRDEICQCKHKFTADTNQNRCIPQKPNQSSENTSPLKVVTIMLIASAVVITGSTLQDTYYP